MKKPRLFSQRNLWILIVIFFAVATMGSIYEAIQDPSKENNAGAVAKSFIVAAMIYVARRDIREMDEER